MTTHDVQNQPPSRVALRPSQLVARYSLPRDRVYKAINSQELPAYDVGSPARPAFLIYIDDFERWLATLRVGSK